MWKKMKEEGFFSILGKLLFLILLCGLLFILDPERARRGIKWIFSQFPTLKVVGDVTPVGLYIFWLVSLWLGFKIGKQVGMKRAASRERKKLGIPFG
ncbi:MAG: hypothetical protein WAV26_13365 [Candidatus Deferrimicrobium sp.]